MDWHAEYVAVLEQNGSSLELSGWASVENRSGATYDDAKLKLIAGTIHRASVPRPVPYMDGIRAMAKMETEVVERGLFEYHLYELPQRATLANNEVKQVGFLRASGVRSIRTSSRNGTSGASPVTPGSGSPFASPGLSRKASKPRKTPAA